MCSGLIGTLIVLMIVATGYGQTSLATGALYGPAGSGLVSIDFLQEGIPVGHLNVASSSISTDAHVRFFVEIPIVPVQDYRLDSFDLEFVSDALQPSIMLEPSGDLLGHGIEYTNSGSTVRLHVPATRSLGDGTILVRFLADKMAFGDHGLHLNAKLTSG